MDNAKKIPNGDRKYTYTDYLTWDDEVRCELHDGEIVVMTSPTVRHQAILGALYLDIGNYLVGKKCKVYLSPLDVRLNFNTKDNQVFQPDILVLCDKNKIDDRAVLGAPDLVIEILSPSTASYDSIYKLQEYLKAGVLEYWIVDPVRNRVNVSILDGVKYITSTYTETDTIESSIIEGLKVNLTEIFKTE